MLLVTIINPRQAKAWNENYGIGARSGAVGNASVTLSDMWSAHHNQAGLAGVSSLQAGVFYENRFGIKELGLKAASIAMPVPGISNGVFGLSFSQFGYSLYNDTKIGLGYAKQLGKKYSVGIQVNYLQTQMGEDYGSAGAITAEAGLIAELITNLYFGVHIFNPTRVKLTEYKIQETVFSERVPTIMRCGLRYKFSEKVQLSVETEKDVQYDPFFKAGIEYRAIEQLYIRGGIATDPGYNSFGFGVLLNKFCIDIAASKHQVLGYSTQINITYDFGKSE